MTNEQLNVLANILFDILKNLHFIGIFIVSIFCLLVAFFIVKNFLKILRNFL